MDLKLNIGTYCRLLWSLFGEHCNYYKELLKIYRILDCNECFAIRNTYTRDICARITWAIINEGCSFFGQNPVASDFAPGSTFLFSTSYLEGITDLVRNAIAIQRATFPHEWASQAPPLAPYGLSPPAGTPPNSMACSGRSTTTGGIQRKSRRTTSGLGGHTSSKNQEHDGSIPQEIQQLCQSVRHPHVVRQANVGPPHNTKVLPPNGPITPMLE
jgi:hypothetical protein